jgi:hypothetical protein
MAFVATDVTTVRRRGVAACDGTIKKGGLSAALDTRTL